MLTRPYHANVNDVGDGGIVTAFLQNNGMAVAFKVEPGHPDWVPHLPPHHIPMDYLTIVTSGRCDQELEGHGHFMLKPGDVLYTPAGVLRTGRVLGDEAFCGFHIYAPVRMDLLFAAQHQIDAEKEGFGEVLLSIPRGEVGRMGSG
jgi:quercetin dioxygenase-like cupin family protein